MLNWMVIFICPVLDIKSLFRQNRSKNDMTGIVEIGKKGDEKSVILHFRKN